MDLPRYNRTYRIIVAHFWSLLHLHGTLISIWSNLTQSVKIGQNWWRRHKCGQNLSYLDTRSYIGPLYVTFGPISSILPQSAILAITWYLRPKFLNSALMWTKSFIPYNLDDIWLPLTKSGHTGPLEAKLCNICHFLASKAYLANSDSLLENCSE